MFQLRCTVRKCEQILQRQARVLQCANGHRFDQARQGYWSLLQPQDSRSKNPGDSQEAVEARRRWLDLGHMQGMIDLLNEWIEVPETNEPKPRILELACGEGSLGASLFADHMVDYCGIDLSKPAIKLASRRWPDATWVLANADRVLPIEDSSVDYLLSLFGRRPADEMARVLKPGGRCIVAVPGGEDLKELREMVQLKAANRDRTTEVTRLLHAAGIRLVQQSSWLHPIELMPNQIDDALAMTYRGRRNVERQRIKADVSIRVTLAAEVLLFER